MAYETEIDCLWDKPALGQQNDSERRAQREKAPDMTHTTSAQSIAGVHHCAITIYTMGAAVKAGNVYKL